jgi:hypothetical protein
MVLGIIQLAAYAEVAALLWNTEPNQARLLLDCKDKDKLGLRQLLEKLSQQSCDLFPAVWDITQSWLAVLTRVLEQNSSDNIRELLLGLGRTISY